MKENNLIEALESVQEGSEVAKLVSDLRPFMPVKYTATILKNIKSRNPDSAVTKYKVDNIVFGGRKHVDKDFYGVRPEAIRLALPNIKNAIETLRLCLEAKKHLQVYEVLQALNEGKTVTICDS